MNTKNNFSIPKWLPWGIIAFSLVYQLWVAFVPFKSYPFCFDEYGHWYQSLIYLKGKLQLDFPQELHALVENHVLWIKGKLFSKYPPAYTVLLTIGQFLNIPAAINPLISAATLFLGFRLASSLFQPFYALTVLILMASSTYFMGYSASFFSQPLALFMAVAGLYQLRLYELKGENRILLSLGFTIGLYFLTRPLDALCFSILTAGVLLFIRKDKNFIKPYLLVFIPAAIGALIYSLHNSYLMGGSGLTVHHNMKEDFVILPDGYSDFSTRVLKGLEIYVARIGTDAFLLFKKFYFWQLGAVTAILAFGLGWWQKTTENRIWRNIFISHFLLLFLFYNFHPLIIRGLPGWPQYGSRYWYASLFSVAALAVLGLSSLKFSRKKEYVILAAAVIFNLFAARHYMREYAARFNLVEKMQQDIIKSCPGKRIVVIKLARSRMPEFVQSFDLRRNPFRDGDLIYVSRFLPLDVQEAFPEHTPCEWYWKGN